MKRITVSFLLMLAFLTLLQAMRMGLLFNDSKYRNEIDSASTVLSADIPSEATQTSYLVVYDAKDNSTKVAAQDTAAYLTYLKKKSTIVTSSADTLNYSQFDGVILFVRDLNRIKSLEAITGYAQQGGTVIFGVAPLINDALNSAYAILQLSEIGPYEVLTTDFKLMTDIMPGLKSQHFTVSNIKGMSLVARLKPSCTVHVRAMDNNPILWQSSYGKGLVFVSNSDLLAFKSGRGLLCGILAASEKDMLFPIVNAQSVLLIGTPGQLPKLADSRLKDGYYMDLDTFVKRIWWPSFKKQAQENKLLLTAVCIPSLSNDIHPPFGGILTKNMLISRGAEIFNMNGEIAYTGYNFSPLALKGEMSKKAVWYPDWLSVNDMATAVQQSTQAFRNVFRYYTVRTYYAPGGMVAASGLEAIRKGNSGISVVCGAYSPVQPSVVSSEFSVSKGMTSFPVISRGFDTSASWDVVGGIYGLGVMSHEFSLIDLIRNNNKTYLQVKDGTDQLIKLVSSINKLDPLTISQASIRVDRQNTIQPYFVHSDRSIRAYCIGFTSGATFYLRTTHTISSAIGCTYTKLYDGMYLVKATEPEFTITWEE